MHDLGEEVRISVLQLLQVGNISGWVTRRYGEMYELCSVLRVVSSSRRSEAVPVDLSASWKISLTCWSGSIWRYAPEERTTGWFFSLLSLYWGG